VTASFKLRDAELKELQGEFTSAEVEGTYTVAASDVGLAIEIPGRSDIVLQPIVRDTFAGAIVGVVTFSRNAGGVVTGFTANSSGARGLRFERLIR
jgi:hypothetical protein